MPRFSDIIGQEMIKEHLINAVNTGNVSHAYIINGERFSGKEYIAKVFAMALQCENRDGADPCGECHACKQALSANQPDIIHLTHEKPNVITVDDIREQINSDIVIKPYACDRKIYIINEAEKMNVQAQNALLKTLEEPPEYAVIIILTTNVDALLPTILSRCVVLNMKPVEDSLVKEFDTNNQGMIYWQASRGTGLRQHNFPKPEETKPNLFAYIVAKDTASKDKTMSAITVEDERFLFCNIKTLNLIPNVLAAQKALEAGVDEVIFHRGQEVTEMAHSNISFIIKGHFVYHPFDNKILPGIAVKHLIKNAKKLGIPTEERIVTLEEALAADELINSSSGAICQRIVRVDEKPVGKKDSETFIKLQDAVFEEFYGSVN